MLPSWVLNPTVLLVLVDTVNDISSSRPTFQRGGCSEVGPQQQHLFQTGFPPQLSWSPADTKEETCHELTYAWWAQGVCRVFDVSLCSSGVYRQGGAHGTLMARHARRCMRFVKAEALFSSFFFFFFFFCPLTSSIDVLSPPSLLSLLPTGQCKLSKSLVLFVTATLTCLHL